MNVTLRNGFLYAPITKESIQASEELRRTRPVENKYSLLNADGSFGGNLAEYYFRDVFAPHLNLNYKECDNYFQDGIVKFPNGYIRLDVKAKTQPNVPQPNHEQSLFSRYSEYVTVQETMYAMFLIHDKKNTKTADGDFEGIYFQGFCFGQEAIKACSNPQHKTKYEHKQKQNVCQDCGKASKFQWRPQGSILGTNTLARFDNYYILLSNLDRPWAKTALPKPFALAPFEPKFMTK